MNSFLIVTSKTSLITFIFYPIAANGVKKRKKREKKVTGKGSTVCIEESY